MAQGPDALPEPRSVAIVFRVALFVSVAAYVLFAGLVVRRGLVQTKLMRQVFCLCTCDCLVCLWELASCGSIVHFEHYCWQNCSIFLPLLRTLQMSSALYTCHIAVCTSLIVRGRKLPRNRSTLLVLPLAPLLCLSLWLETLAGSWQTFEGSQFCEAGGGRNPDFAWQVSILVVLGLTTLAYVYSAVRLGRLSSTTIAARKLKKVLAYVSVFLLCTLPYSLWQSHGGAQTVEEKYSRGEVSTSYLCFYFLYMLTGACNVGVYAYHHWDATLWRRRRIRGDGAAQLRVVMFGSRSTRIISAGASAVTSESIDSASRDGVSLPCARGDAGATESTGVTAATSMRCDQGDAGDSAVNWSIATAASEYGTDAYFS